MMSKEMLQVQEATVRLKNQNKLIKMKKNFTADKINNLVHFDW